MSSCANCEVSFKVKPGNKGYYRFPLDSNLPNMDTTAREQLESLAEASFTPHKKRLGKFLCPDCWSSLGNAVKYKNSFDNFFGATASSSYIATKRQRCETIQSPSTSFKRPRFTSTPMKHGKIGKSLFTPSTSKWDTIITAIRARQYRRAIHKLCTATPGTRKHFADVVARIIRAEAKQLVNLSGDIFPINKSLDLQSIYDFSWEKTLNGLSNNAPVLYSALVGSVTSVRNQTSLIRGSNVNLKPRIGSALALLLHARCPQKCSFMQTLFSVQMWRGRLKRDTIKQFGRLGICAGYDTTLTAIDRIRANFDGAAMKLKNDIEISLQKHIFSTDVYNEDPDLSFALSMGVPNMEDVIFEDTILYSDGNKSNTSSEPGADFDDDDDEQPDDPDEDDDSNEVMASFESSLVSESDSMYMFEDDPVDLDQAEELKQTDEKMPSGFTMCWDNVGKKVITRRPSENVKNKYINMALGYMAVNRVSPSTIKFPDDDTTVNASTIEVDKFLPKLEDVHCLEYRLNVIVGRVITRHLQWFTHFSSSVTHHIIHDKSLPSTRKSLLINLGVFDEDPSSTQGAIGIYEKLQKYIPSVEGKVYTSIVYGDGLSCERGNDAKKARANGLDPTERLEGLEPGVQEFHKEMILLQDFYDLLFKGSSASDRGTLCQVKNLLNFRQVKGDISDNFSHAWELMSVVVESFVCMLMMELLGMKTTDDRPSTAPDDVENDTSENKQVYFDGVCSALVNNIWQALDTDAINEHVAADEELVICCGEDMDDDLIGCESRSRCLNGEMFHHSCVDIDLNNITAPWYCSEACRNLPVCSYDYCDCQTDLGLNEPMIGCEAEPHCLRYEWYHMKCVGINPDKPPKGKWFCSDTCKTIKKGKRSHTRSKRLPQSTSKDHKLLYSTACIWYGLNLLCRRDAVREADGNAMMSYWKFDLLHFFRTKHPKYVIFAHRLLASVNGWLPERLRFDLIHNRTVNYSGGIGRNLPMDFMNEILNRLFKDLLEAAKGRYTDTTIQRCSQIIGPLGEALDSAFDVNVVQEEIYRHRYRAVNRDANVSRLIQLLHDEHLFQKVPGRKHNAFPDFDFNINLAKPDAFITKIKQLSKRLDNLKAVIVNTN